MKKLNWKELEKRISEVQISLRKRYLRPLTVISPYNSKYYQKTTLPIKEVRTFQTEYSFGNEFFGASFDITSSGNKDLGEIGVDIADTIGSSYPKQVTAIEIWLYDELKYPVNCIVVSEYVFRDELALTLLGTRGACYSAVKNGIISMNTSYLYAEVLIQAVKYKEDLDLPNSYFENISFELTIGQKIK